MKPDDFTFMATMLKARSGLVIGEDKIYLLESRLTPVARKHEIASLDALVAKLRTEKPEALLKEVVEAMTTNESFFFRDLKPFDQFKDMVLPALLERRAATKRIRIWSAACSSGQEPYSLAMLLSEAKASLAGWTVELIATDLSTEILDRARDGLFTQFEVQRGLPIQMLVSYFQQEGDKWRITDQLKRMIKFQIFNLLEDPRALGQFDVIYCRNVLIYFDQPTKTKVLERLSSVIASDGYMFLGGAETVLGITDKFQAVPDQRGIYQPTGDKALSA